MTISNTLSERIMHSFVHKFADMKPNELIKIDLQQFKNVADMVNPDILVKIFKRYRPLDKGNNKLANNILSFSLLPVVTCSQKCPGCYDIRSLRYRSVRMKRIVNTLLALSHKKYLYDAIQKQIENSKTCDYVRIHVGGDFFNRQYVNMWRLLAVNNKDKQFYTYTKTVYTKPLLKSGINVVKSRLKDGSFNFDTIDIVKQKAKQHNGVICPATIKKVTDKFCGNKCKACMTKQNVFFIKH